MPEPQRARPAGPENAYPDRMQNFCTSPFLIRKSLIGRFYLEEMKAMEKILMKMSVLLKGNAFCVGLLAHFLFEIRFYLHKEFRTAGIRILSTQRIGGGDLEENGNFLYGKRAALYNVF